MTHKSCMLWGIFMLSLLYGCIDNLPINVEETEDTSGIEVLDKQIEDESKNIKFTVIILNNDTLNDYIELDVIFEIENKVLRTQANYVYSVDILSLSNVTIAFCIKEIANSTFEPTDYKFEIEFKNVKRRNITTED